MWVRIDDGVPQHPKFLQAGREASWFWVCGNCYCNKYLTDGFIAEHALISLSPGAPHRRLAAQLVSAHLWEKTEGGYTVHDFHDYNPKSEHVRTKREQDRERKRIPNGIQTESERNPNGLNVDSKALARTSAPAIPSLIPSHVSTHSNGNGHAQTGIGLDEAWEQFKAAYPAKRRANGYMANQRFIAACEKVGFPTLLAALEQHKGSDDWHKGMIPGLEKWLEQELWIQILERESPTRHASPIGRREVQPMGIRKV